MKTYQYLDNRGRRPDLGKREEALRLRREEGLSYREIGEVMGVSHQRAHQYVTWPVRGYEPSWRGE